MRDKIVPYLIVTATLVSLFLFVSVLRRSLWYSPDQNGIGLASLIESTFKKGDVQITASRNPIRLKVPAIDVNAKVQKVGINRKGNMAVPNNFTDVGWYKFGSAPGEAGNAVIAGHIDNGLAFPGVFKHLNELKKGDDVLVEMEDGRIIHYVVESFTTYDYDEKVEAIFETTGPHYLKLITCTGTWLPSKKTHDKRLVVTAKEKT